MAVEGRTSRAPNRGAYARYRLGAALFRSLPRPAALLLGGNLGLLAGVLDRAQRGVVADNLAHVLGKDASPAKLAQTVRRAYVAYGRYWAEAARLRPGDLAMFERSWSIEGSEHLFQAYKERKGVILALPHVGTWEVGGMWSASVGVPLTAVAERLQPEALFDWFAAERRALGIEVLALNPHVATELTTILRSGGAVALLSDRDVAGDGVEVDFFGERTRLPAGPAVLALRTGAALLPCAVLEAAGRQHRAIICAPLAVERVGRLREDAVRITQALAHELETLIRRHPEQWHVFQPNWPSVQSAAARRTKRR